MVEMSEWDRFVSTGLTGGTRWGRQICHTPAVLLDEMTWGNEVVRRPMSVVRVR
jgi:hypothetical protein